MEPLSNLYWYVSNLFLIIPMLLIGLLLPKKRYYAGRLLAAVGIYVVSDAAIVYLADYHNYFLMIPLNIVSMLIFLLCNTISWKEAVYLKCWCLAEECLGLQLSCMAACVLFPEDFYGHLMACKVAVNLILGLLFLCFMQYLLQSKAYQSAIPNLVPSVMLVIVGVTFNNISFSRINRMTFEVYLYQAFCMLTVNACLYIQLQGFYNQTVARETELRRRLMQEQQKQFEIKKEYIDLINHKYHDIKHELRAVQREDRLEEVRPYEYIIQTGNYLIDTIMTEHARRFEALEASMTCVIDEEINVDFIDLVDLYIILGNALDNAAESFERDMDLPQKYLSIRMYRDKRTVRLIIRNNYSGTIRQTGELPLTGKDQLYHGYGLGSIRDLVKKYKGVMTVRTDNGEFSLNIAIPDRL